ncbi:hypothetical protein JZ751_022690 [Albula glossodonta]|uniref:WHIM1 domain-containing protein n=1 Tax=Albula glossodonta TaxID=121402 RepID=A0A8T2PH06_9TELE|nr:hypothetical protein JZ751_022690 [Albula glossodonta]
MVWNTYPASPQSSLCRSTIYAQSHVLVDLHVKLLRKIGKFVSVDKWEKYLIKVCQEFNSTWAWELEKKGYLEMTVECKTGILKYLCECQFDDNIKFKAAINEEDPDKMRLQPIGRDKDGLMYWYQLDQDHNIRVYVEEQDDLDGSSWKCIVRTRNDLMETLAQLKTQLDPSLVTKKELEEGSTSTSPNPEDEEQKKEELEGNAIKTEDPVDTKPEDEHGNLTKDTGCFTSPDSQSEGKSPVKEEKDLKEVTTGNEAVPMECTENGKKMEAVTETENNEEKPIIDNEVKTITSAIKEEPKAELKQDKCADPLTVIEKPEVPTKTESPMEAKIKMAEDGQKAVKSDQQAKIPLKKREMKLSDDFDSNNGASIPIRNASLTPAKNLPKEDGEAQEELTSSSSLGESLKETEHSPVNTEVRTPTENGNGSEAKGEVLDHSSHRAQLKGEVDHTVSEEETGMSGGITAAATERNKGEVKKDKNEKEEEDRKEKKKVVDDTDKTTESVKDNEEVKKSEEKKTKSMEGEKDKENVEEEKERNKSLEDKEKKKSAEEEEDRKNTNDKPSEEEPAVLDTQAEKKVVEDGTEEDPDSKTTEEESMVLKKKEERGKGRQSSRKKAASPEVEKVDEKAEDIEKEVVGSEEMRKTEEMETSLKGLEDESKHEGGVDAETKQLCDKLEEELQKLDAALKKKERAVRRFDEFDEAIEEAIEEDIKEAEGGEEEEFAVSDNYVESDAEVNSFNDSDFGSSGDGPCLNVWSKKQKKSSLTRGTRQRKPYRKRGYSDDEEVEETEEDEEEEEMVTEESSDFSDSELDLRRRRSSRSLKKQVNYCETSDSEGSQAATNRDKQKSTHRRRLSSSDSEGSFCLDDDEEEKDKKRGARRDTFAERDSRQRRRLLTLKRRRASEEDDDDDSDESEEEERPIRKRLNRIDSDEEEEEEQAKSLMGREDEGLRKAHRMASEEEESPLDYNLVELPSANGQSPIKGLEGFISSRPGGLQGGPKFSGVSAASLAPNGLVSQEMAPQDEEEDDLLGVTDLVDYVCNSEQL